MSYTNWKFWEEVLLRNATRNLHDEDRSCWRGSVRDEYISIFFFICCIFTIFHLINFWLNFLPRYIEKESKCYLASYKEILELEEGKRKWLYSFLLAISFIFLIVQNSSEHYPRFYKWNTAFFCFLSLD